MRLAAYLTAIMKHEELPMGPKHPIVSKPRAIMQFKKVHSKLKISLSSDAAPLVGAWTKAPVLAGYKFYRPKLHSLEKDVQSD